MKREFGGDVQSGVANARVRRLKFHVVLIAAEGPAADGAGACCEAASSGATPRKDDASNGLQRPKSVRRKWPSLPIKRLSGLMSRWM